jgi:type IV secretory pathway VirB2 component (pilin)
MDRRIAVVLYVVAMAAIIVGVDFVFFRNRFWERLIVNIGIVLVFGAPPTSSGFQSLPVPAY